MKKIGILTYFWADNPGTFLQAYATLVILKEYFPNYRVELVDYKHRRLFFKPNKAFISFNQWTKDLVRHIKFKNARKKKLVFSNKKITTKDSKVAWEFIKKQNYDMIVIGSDTILRCLPFHSTYNTVPVYWLPPEINTKKIMLSSSSSGLSLRDLSKEQQKLMLSSISNFDNIGVRDLATVNLIKSLGYKNPERISVIPDPTFFYDIDFSYADRYIKKKGIIFRNKVIAMNLLKSYTWSTELANNFRKRGYDVVSICPAKYADYCLTDISPFEWAGLFKYYDFVITQSFHDTIFSLKCQKPVLSIVRNSNHVTNAGLSKYHGVLDLFDLRNTNLIEDPYIVNSHELEKKIDCILKNFDEFNVKNKTKLIAEKYIDFVKNINA